MGPLGWKKEENRIVMPTVDVVNQSELLFLEKRF